MNLGIVINELKTEHPGYTTTALALEAHRRGHRVFYIGLADMTLGTDENAHAEAWPVPPKGYRSARTFLEAVRRPANTPERLQFEELDVLLLRNDPSDDIHTRPWARLAGIDFGRLATRHGVIVLNDPTGLSRALNKMYLQVFPAEVRPPAIITRNRAEVLDFAAQQGGQIVIKPLAGSGGHNVFQLRLDEPENVNQMIDAVFEDGYAVAQRYLPAAALGDTRVFLMNGRVLEAEGLIAAVRRRRTGGDLRSNLTAGGKATTAAIDDRLFEVAELIRPQLMQDGMFLVGIDLVESQILEINVFSPGALATAGRLMGVNFARVVIDAIELKLEHKRSHRDHLTNCEIATL